ncbi:MAG TPA: hypothetical protein VH397_17240, partial [Xanthobacteraceae bacterium]
GPQHRADGGVDRMVRVIVAHRNLSLTSVARAVAASGRPRPRRVAEGRVYPALEHNYHVAPIYATNACLLDLYNQ